MSDFSPETVRWGADAIDPRELNLPSLKARYILAHLPPPRSEPMKAADDRSGRPPAGRVLEVGSGDGKFLRTLAVQRPDLRIYGCDIRDWTSPVPGIEFRTMTRDIPYDDATFDAVLVVDVLEHVDEPEHVMAEIARVLRPGGRFVGFIPIEGEPRSMYAFYRSLLGDDLYLRTKHHVQAFTYAGVSRMIETHFELADVSHAYHVLGHAMDATFFAAAHLPALAKFWWRENKYYAADTKAGSPLSFALNRLLELGNAVAYLESRLFAKRRLGVAHLLFEARRSDSSRRANAV